MGEMYVEDMGRMREQVAELRAENARLTAALAEACGLLNAAVPAEDDFDMAPTEAMLDEWWQARNAFLAAHADAATRDANG